jgi:hypothetical protein
MVDTMKRNKIRESIVNNEAPRLKKRRGKVFGWKNLNTNLSWDQG